MACVRWPKVMRISKNIGLIKVLDRINTGFERVNAGLDRLGFLPVAFVAILGLAVIATVALEQNAGERAAANFIELQG